MSDDASLVGVAFDYLARFRIAQFLKREDVIRGWMATDGFNKLRFPRNHPHAKLFYITWVDKILAFINDSSMPISEVTEIATHLAKLDQFKKSGVKKEDINVEYLLLESAPQEVLKDLESLLAVFEEKFMVPDIIHPKSTVVFNPWFGVSSLLVRGADADIFIDGMLYDFKTTKDKALKKKDNLQMVGYFLLNELAIATLSDDLGFWYTHLEIEKVAFYKARFGEVEYYDIKKHLPYKEMVRPKLMELAEYFKDSHGLLNFEIMAEVKTAKQYLEEIRNGEF